jgi:2,3-bisphosphoglycerate-dependent phosphoglycerate mutase
MTSFLLIRHAESPWSPDNTRSLSPAGQIAALQLAERLTPMELAAIYSSPYTRALQTVYPLATTRGLAVNAVDDLRECTFGDLGDLPFEGAAQLAWRNFDIVWPGGESLRVAQQRIVRFVHSLSTVHPHRPIVLSSHGTLLTLLLNAFDPSIDHDFWRSLRHPDAFRLELRGPKRAVFARI